MQLYLIFRISTTEGYNDPGGILIYEIFSDDRESLYKKMSTRELQSYLSYEVHAIDQFAAANQAAQPHINIEESRINGNEYPAKVKQQLSSF